MMKRSLLLLGALGVTLGANAQQQQPSVVQMHLKDAGSNMPMPVEGQYRATRSESMDQPKAAGSKTRIYNYVDQLAKANPSILASGSNYVFYPYMWFSGDGKGIYSDGSGGYEADTIKLTSVGSSIHPFWAGYNGSGDWPNGTMITSKTDNYTVDSITFYGVYGRPNSRASVVDTLRIAYTYGGAASGSNLPIYYFTDFTTMHSRYGTDTVRGVFAYYDPARHIMMKKPNTTNPVAAYKDILLTSSDTGFVVASIAAGMSVPAGNLAAASITFISGDITFVPGDTVFRSSTINPTEAFKYGMFRPQVFVEKLASGTTPGFPTYIPGNYNNGMFTQFPVSDSLYYPNWAWSGGTGASSYQFPYVDWRISCPTCAAIGDVNPGAVANISQTANIGLPYPNPANNQVSLPVDMKEAAIVTAKLSNMMGQVLATQNLGKLAAQQHANIRFSTENLADGIYLITVEANGNQVTKRVSVTR
ncbi:MAG: T9SS type A sorting domain-containing protein [Bacteroidetes bacterium]|nr:T9SS type A sorting domain-containing protein [Bacteroidota bacterium]MBS1629699.1 T9SS type A sorting domain-containing protein [Bacteroidota bacterium]